MTDSTVSAINTQATAYQNPYTGMSTGMAHDFFGSQIFGTSDYNISQGQNKNYSFLQEPPQNEAQAVLYQYLASQGATAGSIGGPSPKAYFQASQIASMFSNKNQMPMQNTSFTQNDVFAQSLFSKCM